MENGKNSAVYELSRVSKTYSLGGGQVRAVRDVELIVSEGEFLAVVGPSGSGKTTLLQLLGALDRPTDGTIRFEGRELTRLKDRELTELRRTAIGFVFQQFNLIPTLTAAQNVEVALAPNHVRSRARRARARTLLESVGLANRVDHLPSQLSGGEQQRVAIARALANEPRVVLADEPTGNLDSSTGDEIIDLLRSLSVARRQTVVLITHDADVAACADRIVRMHDGRLLAETRRDEVEPPRVQEGAAKRSSSAGLRWLGRRQGRRERR